MNPYELLEVSPSATDREIKKAFRKLSAEYHPDRLKDDDPEREEKTLKFPQLTEAKEMLLDSELRRAYDQAGWEMVQHIVESRRIREQRKLKCEPIVVRKTITLSQLYHNEDIKIEVPVPVHNEDGTVADTVFPMEFKANSLGKVLAENVGLQKPDHIPGDIIVVNELEDCPFQIKRLDLIYETALDLRDLLSGYRIIVPHPKEDYTVTGKYQFSNGDDDNLLIFKGLGLTHGTRTGDLVVHMIPDLESLDNMSAESKAIICSALDAELGPKQVKEGLKDITADGVSPSQMSGHLPGIEQLIQGGMIPGMPGAMGVPLTINENMEEGGGCPVQ